MYFNSLDLFFGRYRFDTLAFFSLIYYYIIIYFLSLDYLMVLTKCIFLILRYCNFFSWSYGITIFKDYEIYIYIWFLLFVPLHLVPLIYVYLTVWNSSYIFQYLSIFLYVYVYYYIIFSFTWLLDGPIWMHFLDPKVLQSLRIMYIYIYIYVYIQVQHLLLHSLHTKIWHLGFKYF